jgi:dihydrofolate reductase
MLNRISLDGYFASSNEANFGMDWFIHDPEVDKAAHEIAGRMDTLVLGRKTYAGFERSWVPILNNPSAPEHLKSIAEELTDMSKVVFSRTITRSDWRNTKLYDGSLIEIVRQLKEEASTDILVLGSGSIVQQLAEHRLIDDYLFIMTPVVAGAGKPLFPPDCSFGLKLMETRSFESGNVLLHYELKS